MLKYFNINSENWILQRDFSLLISQSLRISHRIIFQCTGISNSFLAIGCNTGNIYVFNIQNSKFKYWSNIISNDSPILGIYFSSSKCYMAYHNKKFQIFIYKLNLINEKSLLIRKIDNSNTSSLHSLRWDEEASKLFCGYSHGVVDVVYIPQNAKDYFQVPSEGLMRLERQEIVQIDFTNDLLLVSTNEKVLLMNFQSKFMITVGTKPRSGQYGACFWFNDLKQLRIVSARPGYRLWIASLNGTVDETQQYKSLNNSSTYKIKEDETRVSGSGQLVSLTMIKDSNLLIAVEHEGPLLIIDLIKKSCISIIDYGTSLSELLCYNERIILNSNREVICLSLTTFKDALLNMLDENVDSKYVIDLFLTLNDEFCDADGSLNLTMNCRQICNTLSPNLLSRIVQTSAESDYRFLETNTLQVYIQDHGEYQNLFKSLRSNSSDVAKISASNSDLSNDFSVESDCTNDADKLKKRNIKISDKIKAMGKTPHLLQVIYDKTSNFLSNIDVLSSSNSELNLLEPYSDIIIHDELDKGGCNNHESITDDFPKNILSDINLMELEANGYIATEKYKQFLEDGCQNYFLESLSNFCKTWLLLNLTYWKQLSNFELYVRNLSASFPIRNTKLSFNSSSNSPILSNDNFFDQESKTKFSNSWSSSVNTKDWIKTLPISDKIFQMTSNLLSHCFFYGTYNQFPELIQQIINVTRITYVSQNYELTVHYFANEYREDVFDKETQIVNVDSYVNDLTDDPNDYFKHLKHILGSQVWSFDSDMFWIQFSINHFYHFLNIKSIRQWLRSGISHNVWLSALNAFKDVYLLQSRKYRNSNLVNKTDLDLEKVLFETLCTDDIYSFVTVDDILSVMKEKNIINWKILIETESLDIRDVLHFALRYNLNLRDYIIQIFKYVSFSIKFSSKYNLIEYIYSQTDVLVSFIYCLLPTTYCQDLPPQTCDCGLLTCYSENNIPENVNILAIEILRWGADQGAFKKSPELLSILMKLCVDSAYHQGYIELLVGMKVVKDLVMIGLQVNKLSILCRLKDCSSVSSSSILEVIDFIIICRRNQIKNTSSGKHCLSCKKELKSEYIPTNLLSWKEIGELIFIKLIEDFNSLKLRQMILSKLALNEVNEMKDIILNFIESSVNNRKAIERNQMIKFIKSEMSSAEASGELTEQYLNIYTMSRQELSGSHWGRVITDNMLCNLCGTKLIINNKLRKERDIVAFCCIHTFHRDCLQQFDLRDDCFLC